VPTDAYAFPSTLAYDSERGASGIDEAVEVRRIMRRRRPLVVTLDRPLAPWNAKSEAIVRDALGPDRLVLSAPREGGHLLVYLRGRELAQ
jgi:hypothetical protein